MNIQFFSPADNNPDLIRFQTQWTDWHTQQLIGLMPTMSNHAIAKLLHATPGLVGHQIRRLGLSRTPEQCEALYRSIKGRLRTYQTHPCQQQPGTVRLLARGGRKERKKIPEWWIILGAGKRMPLRHYLWQTHIGPIPPDHVIVFKDANHRRCILPNLECLPRQESMNRNRALIKAGCQLYSKTDRARENYRRHGEWMRKMHQEGRMPPGWAENQRLGILKAYREGRVRNPMQLLTDVAVAYYLFPKDRQMRKIVQQQAPELLEAKRTQIKLQRELKANENDNHGPTPAN